jgi:hypothetical protein
MLGEWTASRIVILAIPAILVLLGLIVWGFLRKTIRSRLRTEKQLREDPDINEWLVVFGWSRKVLYVPTILTSAVAAILMFSHQGEIWNPVIGGVWLGIFFLNFLVDEYEISIKVLLIVILCAFVLCLWLSLLGWLTAFLRLFKLLNITMNGTAYLIIALILLLAVFISWLRGLFYYVAITPNYMNVQVGPTETGEQISREEYSTRVDTGDFLERLLGFGRIVITFSGQRRQPMMLLIGRIGRKAAKLESIRGKLAIDRFQPSREDGRNP